MSISSHPWNKLSIYRLVVGICSLSVSAQAQVAPPLAELFSGNISPEKPAYAVGEPVALVLAVRFLGSNPIDLPHSLDHQGYAELLEMARPGEREYKRLWTIEEATNERVERHGSLRRTHFEPGETVRKTNWYHCWPEGLGRQLPKGLVFPDAGEYPIRTRVSWKGATYQAETSASIRQRQSKLDQDAYEWLERSGLLCSLTHLWEHARGPVDYGKEAAKYRKLRDDYPESVFTAFFDRTYMTASNIIARPDGKFFHLLGEKPKPTRASP